MAIAIEELFYPQDCYCGSFKLFLADGSPIVHEQCWMALAIHNNREYNGEEIILERLDASRVTVRHSQASASR